MPISDIENLTALGRALTMARDQELITHREFIPSARALASAMITGSMETPSYSAVHGALASMLEATFDRPAAPAPKAHAPAGDLNAQVEIVGQMFDAVVPSDPASQGVNNFLDTVFDLGQANFDGEKTFSAPLLVDPGEIGDNLRLGGIAIISIQEDPDCSAPTRGVLSSVDNRPASGTRLVLGWGERRIALTLDNC